MASFTPTFSEIVDSQGCLSKARANFGKNKQICFSFFNGTVYEHLSDTTKCFDGEGGFDFSKVKNVSLTNEEALMHAALIKAGQVYKDRFLTESRNQPSPPPPSPPGSPEPSTSSDQSGYEPMYRPPIKRPRY